MFAKIVAVLLCLAFSIFVSADEAKRQRRWAHEDECGTTDISIYKNTIHHGQWPFVASIYYVNNDRLNFVCGGTIISKYAVITAAHCIKNKGVKADKRTKDIQIRLGAFNLLNFLERESLFLSPSQIFLHPDWNTFNQNFDADVAILMMQREIQFSQFIKPICLFQISDLVTNIREGWLISYGTTSSSLSNRYHVFPRKFRIPIIDTKTCLRQESRYTQLVSPRTFCAGSKAFSNICQCDLGNGLFVYNNGKFFLAGIASVSYSDGYRECDYNNFAIFSNVHLIAKWIEGVLSGQNFVNEAKNVGNREKIQPVTESTPNFTGIQEENIDVRYFSDAIVFPSDDDDIKVNFLRPTAPSLQVLPPQIPRTKIVPFSIPSQVSRVPVNPSQVSRVPVNPPQVPQIPRIPEFKPPTPVNPPPVIPLEPAIFNQDTFEDTFEPSFDPTRVGPAPLTPVVQPTIPRTTSKPSFLQADCGIMPEENGLIQGGQKAASGQFPWAAAIFRKTSLTGNQVDYAIGALISFRHVFVEALMLSLINDKNGNVSLPQADEIRLFFGFDDLPLITEQTPFSEASDIIVHPKYILGTPVQANVAVILLKKPIVFSRSIFPVCLWDSPTKVKDVIGTSVYSFGYGGQSTAPRSKNKKFVVSQIKSQNECPADYKSVLQNVKDSSTFFCAGGDKNEGICAGDSASLYMKQNNLWYLFATAAYTDVSLKAKPCNPNKAAMFEILSEYTKWIQNVVLTM